MELVSLDPVSSSAASKANSGKAGPTLCTALRSAAARCMARLFREGGQTDLLEPVMRVEVSAPATYISEVLSDLTSRRRGAVLSTESDQWAAGTSVPVTLVGSNAFLFFLFFCFEFW